MTTTVTTWKNEAVANGVAPIPFTFQALSEDEVGVIRADTVLVSGYTVALNGDGTGSVTPAASWGTDDVVIYSKPSFQQLANFTRFGAFYPDQFVPPLDRLARSVIALKGTLEDQLAGLPITVGSGIPHITVKDFGAVGDDATNDGPAFAAAIAFLKTLALTGSYGSGSPRLFIPAGKYYLGTTTLDISHTLRIEGEGSGEAGGPCSQLRWAAGATGIRIQRFNTDGAAGAVGNGVGGDASIIQGLYLKGAFTDMASEGDYHAIHLRARAFIRDCYIENFQGDGIFCHCSSGSGGATEGNANSIRVENVFITGCRNGIWLVGADVNAGSFLGVDVIGNRRWGVYDGTFLGNAYHAPHASSNGAAPSITPTRVHNNGHYFTPIVGTSGHSTNSPPSTAVDDARWYYTGDGAVDTSRSILQWTNGMAVRDGGPYYGASTCLFSNPYAEIDQGPSQGGLKALFLNFTNHSGIRGVWLNAEQGQVRVGELAVVDDGVPCFDTSSGGTFVRNGLLYLDSPSTAFQMAFRGNAGATSYGLINGSAGGYFNYFITNNSPSGHRFQTQTGGDIAVINDTALDLQTGKVLQVGGQKVVGARGAALPADATDLATAITLLNAVKARLKVTGGHGLVAD